MKNIDYIKTLSADKIVELLTDEDTIFEMSFCKICSCSDNCTDTCRTSVLEWLEAEIYDG